MTNQLPTIYIISDGTGETASTMVQAAVIQFPEQEVHLVRCKNIRTENQVENIIDQISEKKGFIVHTVVSPQLSKKIIESAAIKNIPTIDLLGPLLNELNQYLGHSDDSLFQAGILRSAIGERYKKRIDAIEYTVKHDDGKLYTDLDQADIVLVGISRTSKTPLSIFLSHKGWKVANVPMVLTSDLPTELFEIDQRKVVGLIIDEEVLYRIRRKRLENFGQDPGSEYASLNYITQELQQAKTIFKKNKKWPVFNVTDRALEETAAEIIKVISNRLGLTPDSYL